MQLIPGIGPSLAADLRLLGIRTVAGLKGRDPERLYRRLERLTGGPQDRCAVSFAETRKPTPRLLKWWNWTDERMPRKHRME